MIEAAGAGERPDRPALQRSILEVGGLFAPPPLFPLPVWPRAAIPAQKRKQRRRRWILEAVADACCGLNSLAVARAGVALEPGRLDTATPPTAAQDSVRGMLGRRVIAVGPPPPGLCRESALREYLKTVDPYKVERAATAVPYQADLVRVVKEGIRPRPAAALCGPFGKQICFRRARKGAFEQHGACSS